MDRLPTVAVVDPNGGRDVGHHRHWYQLLHSALSEFAQVELINAPAPISSRRDRNAWYAKALKTRLPGSIHQIVFLSGDDALLPLFLCSPWLRRRGLVVHLAMFRPDPNPGIEGRLTWLARTVIRNLLAIALPTSTFYELRLPTFRGRFQHGPRRFTLVDSSHLETRGPVGVDVARTQVRLATQGVRYFLVIGMLGASKHVDTILEAWRKDGPADAKLLLVGQSDRDTADLISAATESDASGIVWVNERTSDTEFDNYIESADYVFTTYRYSSSSGVALRALALGSRVVYGGSSALIRDLEGVTGTYRISPVTAETVGEFFRNTPEMSTPEFQDGSPENLVFPTPIVEAIRKAISAT